MKYMGAALDKAKKIRGERMVAVLMPESMVEEMGLTSMEEDEQLEMEEDEEDETDLAPLAEEKMAKKASIASRLAKKSM